MNPTPGDVHVNVPLTQLSIAFMQAMDDMIADRVFPIVPVGKQADRYYEYKREDWWRIEAQERAPATETVGGGFRVDNSPSYFARVYGFHKDVDDQLRANQDAVINLDRDAMEFVAQQLMLKREKSWAAGYFKTSVWSGDQTGVAAAPGANQFLQWNDVNSTPIEDIRAQLWKIKRLTGRKPNKLVLGPETYLKLADHPDLVDRYKYTQAGIITPQLLAGIFDVDEVLIASAVENTANEGATGSYSFLYGKKALLVYANPRPSLLQPSGGYLFSWTGYLGAGPAGQRIKRFRMEPLAADRVEGEMAFDPKLVAADCGVFFETAVA
jgi:hypothetical protein